VLLDELAVDVHLVVARVGVTTRDDAKGVRSLLEQRRLMRSAGLVVNGLPERGRNYYYLDDEGGSQEVPREDPRELITGR
jgi:hypothetical protein